MESGWQFLSRGLTLLDLCSRHTGLGVKDGLEGRDGGSETRGEVVGKVRQEVLEADLSQEQQPG